MAQMSASTGVNGMYNQYGIAQGSATTGAKSFFGISIVLLRHV